MIKNWLKIFVVHSQQNKWFMGLNTIGISIGIAGLVFALLYWQDEHSYNHWNTEDEKVYQIVSSFKSQNEKWPQTVSPIEPYLKKDFPEVEKYCYFFSHYSIGVLKIDDKSKVVNYLITQNDFFDFFPFKIHYGSSKDALINDETVMISLSVSKHFFGNENPVGKTILLDKKTKVIKGVFEVQGKSSLNPDVIYNSMNSDLARNANEWGNFNYSLLLKIPNKKDLKKVSERLANILYQNRELKWYKEQGLSDEESKKKIKEDGIKIVLDPLKNARLYSKYDGYPGGRGNLQFLRIIVGISVLILILSIINYINLSTANAIKRAKEVRIRKFLGSSNNNIIKQFLFETIIITTIAFFLALAIVELTLPYYNEIINKNLTLINFTFFKTLLIVYMIIILFAGIIPSWYVSKFETLKVLKGNYSRSKSGIWLRNSLLILQFVIASTFIIGSLVINQQVNYLANKEIGFNGEQVIVYKPAFGKIIQMHEKDTTLNFTEEKYKHYEFLKSELQSIKGIKEVTSPTVDFKGENRWSSSFDYGDTTVQATNMFMDFNTLDMMNIEIVKGRNLSSKLASDSIESVLINETTAKMMKEKNLLNKVIKWNNQDLKIIGIVKDFNVNNPYSDIPPMLFAHYKTVDWSIYNMRNFFIKVDKKNIEKTISAIENFNAIHGNPDFPFQYEFVDQSYQNTYQTYTNQKKIFSILNVVVILIASFGLYALASFSMQRRIKEIAIRKTLGASNSQLISLLSKQYLWYCILGYIIAVFPILYMLQQWLNNFVYRIDITWVPFFISFATILLITIIVVFLKGYQSASIDILKQLKYE